MIIVLPTLGLLAIVYIIRPLNSIYFFKYYARERSMKVVILENAAAVARYGADMFIEQIKKKPDTVMGLATGSTPLALYQELINACRNGKISFGRVSSFNLDEYLGISPQHPQSYRYFMNQHLFDHIDIEKTSTFLPLGDAEDSFAACTDYETAIQQKGGIDMQLLGLGRNGHIAFNEPSSSLTSRTRIKTLTRATIADNARFFGPEEYQPHLAITMGIGTILDAKKVVLLATGSSKAEAIKALVEGPLTAACPASALQMHQQAVVIIDEAAAALLADVDFYKHIELENQKLLERLGRL
jgi:glucosamine-6-phosphate deaminase